MTVQATTSAVPPSAAHAHHRLADGHVVREALERYPWPPASRMAAYLAIGAALLAMLLGDLPLNLPRLLAAAAVGAVFLAGFHWLSECQAQMAPRKRALFFGVQLL